MKSLNCYHEKSTRKQNTPLRYSEHTDITNSQAVSQVKFSNFRARRPFNDITHTCIREPVRDRKTVNLHKALNNFTNRKVNQVFSGNFVMHACARVCHQLSKSI